MSSDVPWAGITEGRIVHVRRVGWQRCQPAIVVRHWSDDTVNLLVYRDGSNDDRLDSGRGETTRWSTSRKHESRLVVGVNDNPGNEFWHWPERAL